MSGRLGAASGLLLCMGALDLLPLEFRWHVVLLLASCWAVAAVALDLWQGWAGELSFGHAGFVAVGAYVSTSLRVDHGWPAEAALLAALGLCAVIAAVLGLAVVRLSHFGSAIVTFFFAFVVVALSRSDTLNSVTHGEGGLEVPPARLFGLNLASPHVLLFTALGCALLAVVLTHNFAGGRAGRALLLARRSEAVASAMGVDVRRAKLVAFVYTAIFAGLAGFLLANAVGFVTPEVFPVQSSVTLVAMLVVGGVGTLVGPIIGAVFFLALPEIVQGQEEGQAIVSAIVFLAFLVLLPRGIYPFLARSVSRLFARLFPQARSAAAPRTPAVVPDPVDPLSLAADSVSVRFGSVRSLDDVSLHVAPGTIHAICGPNGAGKTTLLNTLSGLQSPTSGRLHLGSCDTTRLAARSVRRLGLARTFQHPSHVEELSALENVALGLHSIRRWSLLRDLGGAPARRRHEQIVTAQADHALELVGFEPHRRHLPAGALSLAELRLLDIARSLVGGAAVILMDEPTAGLGAEEMATISDALRRVHDERRTTIVLVAHHVEFVLGLATRMTVLDAGRVLADGEPGEVLARPDVVEAFLGSAHGGAVVDHARS